jgi:hypothetical protein
VSWLSQSGKKPASGSDEGLQWIAETAAINASALMVDFQWSGNLFHPIMYLKIVVPVVTCFIAILSISAGATTLQVSEDSYSYKSGIMGKISGKSDRLAISPDAQAFVRFDTGDFSKQIPADDVIGARLTFYIAERLTVGALGVHRVTSEWTESPSGTRKAPSYVKVPLATLPAASLRPGQFVVIDVTDLAKRWLNSPEKDFGFVIVGDGKSSYLIPSKEGPAGGPSATLEIDHHPVINDSRISAGLNAGKLGNGSVDNDELGFLNGVNSPVQGQLDAHGGDLADLKLIASAQGTGLDGVNSEIAQLEKGLGELDSTATTLGNDLAGLDSKVTGLGNDLTNLAASSAGKVSKAGDTMTGALLLPADGLKVGINQFVLANGNTGVGTSNPQSKLDVRGDIRLGSAGEDFAAGGGENLRIIRGSLDWDKVNWTVTAGKGFTLTRDTAGNVVITFNQPFASIPSVTATQYGLVSGFSIVNLEKTQATLDLYSRPDYKHSVHFIFIGPR